MTDVVRVIIDTNHIISAILSGRGASAKLVDWMTGEEDYFQLLLPEPIWQEYTTVSDWSIPASRQPEEERIFNVLRTHSAWIEPDIQLHVNLASRLEGACEPGKILISHPTWGLVKDEIECMPKGKINVKGFSHPVTVYDKYEYAQVFKKYHMVVGTTINSDPKM